MSVKAFRIVRIALLAIAVIACIVGVVKSTNAAKKAATDVSRIEVEIIDKKGYVKSEYSSKHYYIDFTFRITNHTGVEWAYLDIRTEVFDRNGRSLGTITTPFGSTYSSNALGLEVGETITKVSTIDVNESRVDDFFAAMYESDLSDLRYESSVTSGNYIKD